MVMLQVYVMADCWNCAEARRLVADVAARFPQIGVELIDLTAVPPPEIVFAAPTYLLDGRLLFLGNPTSSQLSQAIQQKLGQIAR